MKRITAILAGTALIASSAAVAHAYEPPEPQTLQLFRNGMNVVGVDVSPGIYVTTVPETYTLSMADRPNPGYCYVSRLNTTTPSFMFGEIRGEWDEAANGGPIIASADYKGTGTRIALKILPTDKAVEVDCGIDTYWRKTR